jgi:putative methyltransferase (TIGR04325 family)
MSPSWKAAARLITPPLVLQLARRWRRPPTPAPTGLRLTGDYASWAAALAASEGYDTDIILAKTTDALLKVKRGEAVYERDSMLFDTIHYSWPLLSGLLWAAARHGGNLNVLDFGGSLGSTYFQNRTFLSDLHAVRWNIVEQSKQVAAGQRHLQDETLRFYPAIQDCLAATQPQVILLSSVLQYVERPDQVLDELAASPCDTLIVDRTPFWAGATDRLCVQHVPATIYAASYPSWVFSSWHFRERLTPRWQIVAEWDNPDHLPGPIPFAYCGLLAVRHQHAEPSTELFAGLAE